MKNSRLFILLSLLIIFSSYSHLAWSLENPNNEKKFYFAIDTGYPEYVLLESGYYFYKNFGVRVKGIKPKDDCYIFHSGLMYRFMKSAVRPYLFADYILAKEKFKYSLYDINNDSLSNGYDSYYLSLLQLGLGIQLNASESISFNIEPGVYFPIHSDKDKIANTKIKKYLVFSNEFDLSFNISVRFWVF